MRTQTMRAGSAIYTARTMVAARPSRSRREKRIARLRREARIRSLLLVLISVILTTAAVLTITAHKANADRMDVPTYKYYTSVSVKSGDTLWSIAQEYISCEYEDTNDYIREVRSINHLVGNDLTPGEYLTVPYYSTEYKP